MESLGDLSRYPSGIYFFAIFTLYLIFFQIPHAFQQVLSFETTLTLGMALTAYEALRIRWEEFQIDNPNTCNVIQPGLDKLAEYQTFARNTPAYYIATSILILISTLNIY